MGVHRHTITVQETRKQHKMAGSRVPMTLRDSFFNDSFFKSTWDDFEKVRENMFKESKEMRKNFEDEFKKMEGSTSHNMLQFLQPDAGVLRLLQPDDGVRPRPGEGTGGWCQGSRCCRAWPTPTSPSSSTSSRPRTARSSASRTSRTSSR